MIHFGYLILTGILCLIAGAAACYGLQITLAEHYNRAISAIEAASRAWRF
jgi:hypothetical protein